jgi:hypothetical protein
LPPRPRILSSRQVLPGWKPMILFDLRCAAGHAFEAWFRDGAAYEEQAAEGTLGCPVCGSREVSKALMAPAVRSRARPDPELVAQAMKALRKVQDHVEKTFDHVGPRFPEEARRIHYGEADKRNIYGEASASEVEALVEEGIEVGRMPWLPRHDG